MRDLLKNHAVAASTSSIGTISATALHHYPGLNCQPEALREYVPETAVVATPQRAVEATGERKPYPMAEKAGAPTVEPEVEGATAGMTEPVPEVAADEGGENRRTRCGRPDAIRARSPRRSRAGDISVHIETN